MGIVITYGGQNVTMHLDRIHQKKSSCLTEISLGRLTEFIRHTDIVILLGSSITPTVRGREYRYNVITCCCWYGLIHKSSKKVCCGLRWILINVFRVKQQVTTPPKCTLLLIVAVLPALCENCFLLFHLPVRICGYSVVTGFHA